MFQYDFVEVQIQSSFKTGPTASFDRSVEIIKERAAEGWELQQLVAVPNEKTGAFSIQKYVIIFKKKINEE
mgnify:CR=1 FL=1